MMKRIVPILWYFMAGLILLGFVGLAGYSMSELGVPTVALSHLFPTISAILMSVALGLAYHLMAKITRSITCSVLGLIHWIFALIGRLTDLFAQGLQVQLMSGSDHDFTIMAAVYGAASVLGIIGIILFLAALITAISSAPKRDIDTFA